MKQSVTPHRPTRGTHHGSAVGTTKQTVIVVDDDWCSRVLVKELLEQEGMAVQCASSAEEGLSMIADRTFTLLITDLNMPGMNGLALARKSQEIAPHMPVIMSTGNLSPDIPRLAAEAGIAAVLAKPFYPHDMLTVVKTELEKLQASA